MKALLFGISNLFGGFALAIFIADVPYYIGFIALILQILILLFIFLTKTKIK